MELAVTLPILVVIFLATADFARVFYTSIALTNAARAGAQYGAYNAAQSGNFTTMQTTAVNATNVPGISAVASRLCQCATDSGVFSATLPTNNCTSDETISCPAGHRVITVTVTTSKTFTMLANSVPGLPGSVNLTRTATLRVVE